MMNLFSKLSTWYFSRKALPYWSIILLDCLVILFSGLLVYALNNGIFATMGIFWHLSLTWGVCLVPYLVGFRLFRTYSGIIRYSSFVDLQRVGFAVLFGVVCVVTFQEFTDFSPYLVYIRKRDLVLSSLLAMSLMWAMRVFVKYFYVTTFRQSKAERAFIFGVKQGGISLAKSIQNQDPAQYVLAGFVSEAGNMQNRILMGVRVYPFDEELIDAMRRERAALADDVPARRRLLQNCARLFPAQERQDFRRDSAHADGIRQQFFHQRPQDIRPKRPIRRGNRDFRRRAERCPAAFTRLTPGFLQHERRANPHHAACKRNFPRLQHGDDIPAQLPRFRRQRRVHLARRQRHGEGQAHPPEGHRRQAVQQHFHHMLTGGTARALVIIHRADDAGVIAAGGGDGVLAALGLQGAETIRALKWAVPLPVWQKFGVALRGGVIRQMQRCIQLAAQFRRTRHAQQAEIILAREGDCPPVAAGMAALAALAGKISVIIRHKEIARVHRASAPSNDFRDDYSTF